MGPAQCCPFPQETFVDNFVVRIQVKDKKAATKEDPMKIKYF